MQVRKQNPNRWYLVMVFCILVAFCVFIIAPRIGYDLESAHSLAIMIGVWAPTLGILGVRAELMQKKDQ
jgi:uncharacterized membrane protein HdeD (DUF308 family)